MLRSREKATLAKNVSRLVKTDPRPRTEIAQLCHVSDGAIGNMMYGNGNPTLDSIVRIARFFKLELADLFTDDPRPARLVAQEPLALYHPDTQLNRLLSTFSQLTTADQGEFLSAMEARAVKNAEIVSELSLRNSPAAAAFKPAASDADVVRKMRLSSPP